MVGILGQDNDLIRAGHVGACAKNRFLEVRAILFLRRELACRSIEDLDAWHKKFHIKSRASQDYKLFIVYWAKRGKDARLHPLGRYAYQLPLVRFLALAI